VLSEELAIFSWRNRPLDEKPNVSLNFGHFLIYLVLPRHHSFHSLNFTSKCFHLRFFHMEAYLPNEQK
jgi:hypothetical protein